MTMLKIPKTIIEQCEGGKELKNVAVVMEK